MQPVLEPVADEQKRERDRKRDRDNPPLPDPAGNAETGREPGTGGGGQPANPKMMFGAHDDPCAEKTDAGEDPLNDPAGFAGNCRGIAGRGGQHHDHCGGKPHQAKRLQADRLAMKVAIETDQAARNRGDAKTQHNLRPIQQCDDLQLRARNDRPRLGLSQSGNCISYRTPTAYFGNRPIM